MRIFIPGFTLDVDRAAWATEYGIENTNDAVSEDVLTYYTPEAMIAGSPLAQPAAPGEKAAVTVVRS